LDLVGFFSFLDGPELMGILHEVGVKLLEPLNKLESHHTPKHLVPGDFVDPLRTIHHCFFRNVLVPLDQLFEFDNI